MMMGYLNGRELAKIKLLSKQLEDVVEKKQGNLLEYCKTTSEGSKCSEFILKFQNLPNSRYCLEFCKEYLRQYLKPAAKLWEQIHLEYQLQPPANRYSNHLNFLINQI